MKIGTMSIVCGTSACNAKCPFCVSKMTPTADLDPTHVNWRNLGVACKLAEKAGATTCLITGKGEPTLYPDLITRYIESVSNHFPFIELQTNGMKLKDLGNVSYMGKDDIAPRQMSYLDVWYDLGLTTVCLSAVETGYANKGIYGKDYPEITETVKLLHSIGFSVRLSIMMLKKYIDSPKQVERVVNFCKEQKIKQLTLRPIARPENTDNEISKWVANHALDDNEILNIKHRVIERATPVLHLSHGATVYDYEGQNLCLANCLTTNDTDENMRQIIFFPDGTISYDWKFSGAVLL